MLNCDLLIVDLETTSLTPGEILELALVVVSSKTLKPICSTSTYVKIDGDVEPGAEAVHGISKTKVMSEGVPTYEARRLFKSFNQNTLVCGYNLGFDISFLLAGGYLQEKPPFLDLLVNIRALDRFVKGQGRHKLTTTCERWGVPFSGAAHSALADALATAGLLRALVEAGKLSLSDWSFNGQEALRAVQDADYQRWKARQL